MDRHAFVENHLSHQLNTVLSGTTTSLIIAGVPSATYLTGVIRKIIMCKALRY
jgi:hypothetical protein